MTDPDIISIGQRTAAIMRGAVSTVEITPPAMLERAVAQGAPIEVLERLISLKERWDANEARKAFDTAFALAKAETPEIVKTQEVKYGTTSYKHEDLAEVLKLVDEWLAKFDMFVRFRTISEPNQPVRVTCIVSHKDGYREENTLTAAPDTGPGRNSVQAVGSVCTYLQRYTLKAALGLAAAKDDDAVAAGPKNQEPVITDEQAEILQKLITFTATDITVFLKAIGVPSVADIPAARFRDLHLLFLERKKNKQQKDGAINE